LALGESLTNRILSTFSVEIGGKRSLTSNTEYVLNAGTRRKIHSLNFNNNKRFSFLFDNAFLKTNNLCCCDECCESVETATTVLHSTYCNGGLLCAHCAYLGYLSPTALMTRFPLFSILRFNKISATYSTVLHSSFAGIFSGFFAAMIIRTGSGATHLHSEMEARSRSGAKSVCST
jgi:hypothetical protein